MAESNAGSMRLRSHHEVQFEPGGAMLQLK
jgi:hypothetical protein